MKIEVKEEHTSYGLSKKDLVENVLYESIGGQICFVVQNQVVCLADDTNPFIYWIDRKDNTPWFRELGFGAKVTLMQGKIR